MTTGTEHTVQSWSMPYKYRAIVHSPHSCSAGILQGTVDWASPSPAVRTTHPACVCVNVGKKYTVQESNPAHAFRGGNNGRCLQYDGTAVTMQQIRQVSGFAQRWRSTHTTPLNVIRQEQIAFGYLVKQKWTEEVNTGFSPNYLHTYLLLEKLTGSQLVKKFQAFYGTRRFITALISARHMSLSWARSIHSMPPTPFLKIHL